MSWHPLTSVLCLLATGCAGALAGAPWWPMPDEEAPVRVLSPSDASHLGAPEGLRATSGEYRMIPLKWDPVLTGDVAGYVVESATSAEGPFEQLAIVEGRGRLAYVDGGQSKPLGDGVTRFYRLRAFDPDSRVGASSSEVAVATTAPLPGPPAGILAYSRQPREIPLSWQAVEGPSVGGYRVERSPAPEGPYEVVAELSGRHLTSYLDGELGDLRVFYYRLRTTNLDGVPGEPSQPVRAVTKPVPLPPLGLRIADQKLGSNVLRWEANVEEDLVDYQLFRLDGDGIARPVSTAPVDELQATDPEVGAGETITYVARARDRDGLVSADSLPIEVVAEGYGLQATAQADGILLRWNPRTDEGFVDALIERRGRLETRRIYRSHSGRFLDEDVAAGRRYEYVVTLERLDGRRAPPSRPAHAQWSGDSGGAE